jgi:peptide/nickel transport system substrate-binding protein
VPPARPAAGRRLLTQLAIALSGIVIVGALLGSFAQTAEITEAPDTGGAYVEGLAGFPQAINPVLASDDASNTLVALLFDGLTRTDGQGQVVPGLASSWDVTPDGRSFTFHLRAGARWHDGTPVTAEDAVYTYGILRDPAYQGPYGAQWRDVNVEKVDDRTVRLSLPKDAFAPFLEYTTVGLLPSHILGTVGARDLAAHRFNIKPVGSGPYLLKELSPDRITLEAFGDHLPAPFLGRIIFRIYPNYKTILTALERDEVEGAPLVEPGDVERVSGLRDVRIYDSPGNTVTMLFMNVSHPVLSEKSVRLAVASAIDRQRLMEVARGGRARKADGPILPSSWAYDATVKRPDYDPARARQLLEEAGWRADGTGGPGRARDGEPLRLVVLTNDRPERLAVATEIQKQLVAVGIDIEIQATGAGGLVQDFLLPRKYELAVYSWDFNGFDPDPYSLWHSTQAAPNGLNITGWGNRKADEALERGRRATDRAERVKAYADFQAAFADDIPAMPLYLPTYEYAISTKIRGVKTGVVANPPDRFRNVAEWYAKTRREVSARRS